MPLQRPLLELVRCTSRSVSPDSETQCPSRKRRGVLVKLRGPPVVKLHRRAQRRPGGRPGGAPVPYRALRDRAVTRRRRWSLRRSCRAHTDRAAHARSCCCAPRSVARYRLAAIGTALHAPGSLKSASSKGAHMAHQTEAAVGCVRVPADGGTSSLECVSIWLS